MEVDDFDSEVFGGDLVAVVDDDVVETLGDAGDVAGGGFLESGGSVDGVVGDLGLHGLSLLEVGSGVVLSLSVVRSGLLNQSLGNVGANKIDSTVEHFFFVGVIYFLVV